ncbi:hypothetical protein ABC855_g2612 [[Candida] zeylanoides]
MKVAFVAATLLAAATAAPAPQLVTVWQVATQVLNADGSVYTDVPPAPAAASPVAAASAVSTAAAAATPAPASSSTNSILSWFRSLVGGLDSAAQSPVAAPASSSAPAVSYAYSAYAPTSAATSVAAVSTATSAAATSAAATSAASSSGGGSSGGLYADISKSPSLDQTWAKNVLDAHNQKRALHSAPALAWDKTVYEYAQAYADAYDCSGVLTHSHGPYGENLAAGYKSGVASLDAWYDEGKTYDYSAANSYDHFTQVVWVGTTKVGCAYKDCSAENWGQYVICSYDPAGNVVGRSKANVLQ